jgi:hypothetical protein
MVVDKSWMTEAEKKKEEQKYTTMKNKKSVATLEDGMLSLDKTTSQGEKRTLEEHHHDRAPKRRRKLVHKKESEDWGVAPIPVEEDRLEFLHGSGSMNASRKAAATGGQPKMRVYTGSEWLARKVVDALVDRAWFTILLEEAELESSKAAALQHQDLGLG